MVFMYSYAFQSNALTFVFLPAPSIAISIVRYPSYFTSLRNLYQEAEVVEGPWRGSVDVRQVQVNRVSRIFSTKSMGSSSIVSAIILYGSVLLNLTSGTPKRCVIIIAIRRWKRDATMTCAYFFHSLR
jgi:ABC-type glycerol-3-phosphate transport system permease component